LARLLSTAFVLALLAATVGAFALTQGAKTEPSPIFGTKIDKLFSPDCGCEKNEAAIDFRLRKADRLEVWMEHDGDRVTTLVSGRDFPAGPVSLAFSGFTEAGRTLPDGVYVPVVRLARSHRTITLPNPIRIDKRPPTIAVPKTKIAIRSPDGDGRADVFRASYRLDEPAHAILYVNGRRALFTRRQQQRGELLWNGKVEGHSARPGIYVLQASAQDRAGNRSRPYPFAVVQVRYVLLGRKRVVVAPGRRFAIRVSTDSPTVEWRLHGHTGVARRGTIKIRAPRKPGVYRLYVTASGHAAKATVVVA
jgi:hypothetical protein